MLQQSKNQNSMASTGPVQSGPRAVYLVALLAVFLLGLGLRLYALDEDSLWLDEIFTATTSQKDLWSIPQFLATSDSHPPLLFLTAKATASLWGSSEFIIRLPAALLGAASLLLIYKVGVMLWGRREGLIAAFLLCINPYHIRYSQEARNYSPMVFLTLLSLIFLLLALQRDQKRWWFLFAVCASLNLYTHNFAFLILGSEALFATWVIAERWLSSRQQPRDVTPDETALAPARAAAVRSDPAGPTRQAMHLVASLALVAVFYLPWLPFLYQQIFGGVIRFTGVGFGEPAGARLSSGFFTEALEVYTGARGLLLLLFLALFVVGLARSRARSIALALLWIVPPFVLPFIARSGHHFSLKYAIFIVPLLLLGVARGISVIIDFIASRFRVAREDKHLIPVVASIVIVGVFAAISAGPVRAYYLEQKTDYRGVATYLENRLLPGDLILVDGVKYHTGSDADWTKLCLSYYIGQARLKETPALAVDRSLWTNLQGVTQPQGEVVAVVSRQTRPSAWDHQEHLMIIDFEGLSVIHLPQPTREAIRDTTALLQGLLDLLQRPDARFDVRLALAGTYAQSGNYGEAAFQVVLAGRDVPGSRAADDLAQTVSQLEPYLHVQIEDITVGDSLSLRGYSQEPATLQGGETITVTLWWETREEMDIDYTGFIHVIAPDGTILAQEDSLLRSGARATSSWRVGELVSHEHELELPAAAVAGQYAIRTGAYDWRTGERLAARTPDGARAPDDAVTLATLTLER